MASAPIKFRCFRCNQLMGVSRSKAGAVVACPKCQVELVVPDPEESPANLGMSNPSSSNDGGVSLVLLDIRPEDIRAEPGHWVHSAEPSPLDAAPAPFEPFQQPITMPQVAVAFEAYQPVAEVAHGPAPLPAEPPQAQPPPQRIATPPLPPSRPVIAPQPANFAPVLPTIQIDDSPGVVRSQRIVPQLRSRDLVLPRSVVASWSLFVLCALALAFAAGLLAGHFVWVSR